MYFQLEVYYYSNEANKNKYKNFQLIAKCLSRRFFVGLKSRLKRRGKLITKLEYQRKPKWKENSIEIRSG